MTEQSNAAAERSAHVLRGGGGPMDEVSPVVEVAPGRWQLRRVWELEQALREVIARADAGCAVAYVVRPAREALR